MTLTLLLTDPVSGGERMLTKSEVAKHFRVSTRWIEQAHYRGLPSRMVGGRRRYYLSQVDAWMCDAYAAAAA